MNTILLCRSVTRVQKQRTINHAGSLFQGSARSNSAVALEDPASNGLCNVESSGEKGVGVYAGASIKKFTTILKSRAVSSSSEKDKYSVQVSWDKHVQMDSPARLINHSCEANVGVRDNELGAYDFVALKDIDAGEELVWDYGSVEFDATEIKQCLCGSPSCRGGHINFEDSHESIRKQYGNFYARYLHDWTHEEGTSASKE